MGFSSHAQIYCNGGEELTGSLSSVESDRPCTSTKPEPTGKRGAFGEFPLVTFATCNGRDTIVARRALSPSTPRAFRRDPSGSRGLTAKARPSKGVCRAHQCRTALARARSKWKQERVVNFALDNESPIQGLSMLIRRINARSSASIGGRPPEGPDFQRQ